MAIQQINLGSQPKGVGGNNSREAGEKINANFEDLDERVASAKSVADSKTTNATDAHLLNRSNHTGTQSISTILGLQVALDSAASQTNISGNAGTATKLQTPRTINGVSFDGTQNILLPSSGEYSLPTASASVLGGIKVGSGLDISNSVLSVGTLNQSTTGNAATATKLQTARTISLTGKVTGSVSFDGSANASITTSITGLGAANGIATLDSNGQVPSTQLPSYVDDVLEYVNVAAFPTTGVAGKIYVETTGNTTYRWGGTAYVKITSGEVSSVAGKTGIVTLSKADVGLANVDNTADSSKNVASASKLTTACTIGGVSFNGTANINLPGVNTTGNQSTTGNAATATKLATPVQINGVPFDGSQSISIVAPGGGAGGSTSYADTAGKLANPVQIHGVNFDGSAGFDIPNFTATKSGVVPAAGSDTTKYLRSDGTWQVPTNTTYTVFGASPGLVPAKVGSTTTKFLREDGTWVIPADTTYALLTTANAEGGTATIANTISAKVLKEAIQYHAPTGGGMNFAAKVEIELEIVFDFVSGDYHTSGNILSVSNQANIASAVMDSNGILCLTFNTPISNPNLIVTTKGEIKHVTYEGENYSYLTSMQAGNFNGTMNSYSLYSIFQDDEKGYVNTNTKLYISCNLFLAPGTGGFYSLYSAFPARFNLGIIDA